MNGDPYLRRAQEAVNAARNKLPGYKGDCSECIYSYRSIDGRKCDHPTVELVAFNLTDAYAKNRIIECSEQRDRESVWGPVVCGPNGALLEKKVGFFARLFGNTVQAKAQ